MTLKTTLLAAAVAGGIGPRRTGHHLRHGRQVRQVLQRGRPTTAPSAGRRKPARPTSSSRSPTRRSASRRCAAWPNAAPTRSSASASARASSDREGGQGLPEAASSRSSTCVVKLPNVQSIVFKEHEGSFLVGMMAALASKTGKVGFVGGMDIPLIRKFQCGYEQGAKYANPKVEVVRQHDRHHAARPGTTRRAAASWPRRSSPRAPTWSSPPPAAPASASTRRPRTPASWPSASTATRTTCSPAPC